MNVDNDDDILQDTYSMRKTQSHVPDKSFYIMTQCLLTIAPLSSAFFKIEPSNQGKCLHVNKISFKAECVRATFYRAIPL